MTIVAWCALLPLLAAALVALLRRSWGRFLFLAAVGAAIIGWLAVPRSVCSERIVLVVESANQLPIASELWLGARAPLSSSACALVILDGTAASEPRALEWRDDCVNLPALAPTRVSTPTSALHLVERDGLDHARARRLYDWLVGNRTRLVFLVSDPGAWNQARWSIDVATELAALHTGGVTVDVVETGRIQGLRARPKLRIEPRQPFVPAIGEQKDRYSFDLAIDGEPQRDAVHAMERACSLDGECLEDPDCPSGICREGSCGAATGTVKAWRLDRGSVATEASPNTRDGLRVTSPQSLASFKKGFPNLQQGWHALHCRVQYTLSERGTTTLDATTYVPARLAEALVIQGAGTRSWLSEKAPTLESQRAALDRVLYDHVLGHSNSIAQSIVMGPPVFERTLDHATPAPCTDQAQCEQASLIVINDATTEFWKTYCDWIMNRVESGMNLIVSSAPPALDVCPRLPVHAKTEQGHPAGWFDRRPKVTFLLDPSRLGHLRYAPTPVGAVTGAHLASSALDDGFTTQLEIMDAVVNADGAFARGRAPGPIPSTRSDGKRSFRQYEIADLGIAWSSYETSPVDEEQAQMIAQSRIADRLARWKKDDRSDKRYGIDDTVVIFAYAVDQRSRAVRARIADVLATGAHVLVVPLESPFPAVAAPLAPGVSAQLGPRSPGPFKDANAKLEQRAEVLDPVSLADASTGVARTGAQIRDRLRARDRGDLMHVQVANLGRFIDERAIAGGDGSSHLPTTSTAGAPLHFQLLTVSHPRSVLELMRMVEEPKVGDPARALDPIPIGYGAFVGRGHVLVLGYSIFEGALEKFPFGVPWVNDPTARLTVDAKPDVWGPRRILDLGWLTSRLEPLPAKRPRVVAIDVLADSALVLTVRQLMSERVPFESMYLNPAGDDATRFDCVRGERTVDLSLRSLHPEQHLATFELAASGWQRVCKGVACNVSLCRQSCADPECGPAVASDDAILLGPPRHASHLVLDDVQPLDQARLLASYAGGRSRGGLRPLRRANRPVAIVWIGTLMAMLWLRRLARRIRVRRTVPVEAPGNDTVANVRGYVREAGEAFGVPSSDVSAGAVAGLRPIDPGDRLRAALRQDLFLMSGVVGPELAGNLRIQPRFDQRTRRVLFVVNIGRSMQLPGSDKLRAAATVCEVVAELVWASRGEVRIALVGGASPVEAIALAPGGAAPSDAIFNAPRARSWHAYLSSDLAEPGDTVIYVSDYLNEDLSRLARTVEDIESEGSVLGFVRVVAPSEAQLVDFGVHPPTGTVLDRSDWAGDDLLREYARFGAELDALLDHATGGVTHISSTTHIADVIAAVRSSRLLPFLK